MIVSLGWPFLQRYFMKQDVFTVFPPYMASANISLPQTTRINRHYSERTILQVTT